MSDLDRRRAEDELIAIRCQLGERAAFADLVERFQQPLLAHARRLFGADAEDAVQDIWVRVIRQLPALKDPASLRAYIFTIAHRAAADRFRVAYREAERRLAYANEPTASASESDAQEQLEADDLIARLPPVEREVIALVHREGFSMAEAAHITGVAEGTVKSRLHRARQTLARLYKEND